MNIKIQSLHFTPQKKLRDFVNEKVNKLSHLYNRIESGEVCLKLDKSDKTENKICEIRLVVPGNDLFAKRQCETFEKATNQTIQALQKQIEKMKIKFEKR